MYAVIADRGKQYFVKPGERIRVDHRSEAPGDQVVFDRILLVSDDAGEVRTGAPIVDGVRVETTVLGEFKARKVIVFKKKRRKDYRRKQGHRQLYTDLQVDRIV